MLTSYITNSTVMNMRKLTLIQNDCMIIESSYLHFRTCSTFVFFLVQDHMMHLVVMSLSLLSSGLFPVFVYHDLYTFHEDWLFCRMAVNESLLPNDCIHYAVFTRIPERQCCVHLSACIRRRVMPTDLIAEAVDSGQLVMVMSMSALSTVKSLLFPFVFKYVVGDTQRLCKYPVSHHTFAHQIEYLLLILNV